MGVKALADNGAWVAFDDAKLEYLGTELPGYNVGIPSSSIAEGSYVQEINAWTLSFNEATSNVQGAVFNILNSANRVSLYKGDTKVADFMPFLSETTVTVNFTGVQIEAAADYRLEFPAGTVGYAGQVSNEAFNVSFHTPAVFDGTYYLYNTYTNNYISRGGEWATAAVMDDWGVAMILNTSVEGITTLKCFDNQLYLYNNGYCFADGGTGLQFTMSQVTGGYKFLNTSNNRYLAVYEGRAVSDAQEGGNLVGTSNIWTLESTADHVANYTRNADAQAATAATAANISGVNTKAALDAKITSDYGTVEVPITGAKAERYNWYAAVVQENTPSEYYKETVENLVPGLYRLSADAFQRACGFEDVAAADGARGCIYLYANDAKTQIKSVMEYGANEPYNAETDYVNNNLYYANTENTGYMALETGNFNNVVYVYVPADDGAETGTLTFGINNPNRLGNNVSRGTWAVFDNFRLERITESITLDETSETAPPKAQHVDVIFNRSIIANNNVSSGNAWNTICFPFSMSSSLIKSTFGNNTRVMALSRVETEGDMSTLTFEEVSEIEANVPYILQTDQAGTVYTFTDIDVTPDENLTVTVDGLDFVGNYIYPKVMTNEGGEDYYVLNDVFKKSTGNTKIKGFRAYFHVPEGSGIKALGFNFEGGTTSIDGIDSDNVNFPADIYNVGGMLVRKNATSVDNLPAGIYFINGQKVLKR